MKNIKQILLLSICTIIGGVSNLAYSAQDFSFDLDAAINDANDTSGAAQGTDTTAPAGSSAKAIYSSVDAKSYLTATSSSYYDPALIESLIEKYKEKNYVGCIQEAQSKMQQDNPNPVAMYYMALSYTQIGDVKAALDLYDEILKLKPSDTLAECAVRGRDCLIGGPACPNIGVEGADIDAQVQEYKDSATLINVNTTDLKELPAMLVQEQEEVQPEVTATEQQEEVVAQETITPPNSEEVAQAIKTLQNAGITLSLQPNATQLNPSYNSEMAQISMLLGNNNGTNQDRSFDMLPYMMAQSQSNPGQYNPQMLQAMMMNYMMPSMDFNSNNKNY